jgi:hypothetical protein
MRNVVSDFGRKQKLQDYMNEVLSREFRQKKDVIKGDKGGKAYA